MCLGRYPRYRDFGIDTTELIVSREPRCDLRTYKMRLIDKEPASDDIDEQVSAGTENYTYLVSQRASVSHIGTAPSI